MKSKICMKNKVENLDEFVELIRMINHMIFMEQLTKNEGKMIINRVLKILESK